MFNFMLTARPFSFQLLYQPFGTCHLCGGKLPDTVGSGQPSHSKLQENSAHKFMVGNDGVNNQIGFG